MSSPFGTKSGEPVNRCRLKRRTAKVAAQTRSEIQKSGGFWRANRRTKAIEGMKTERSGNGNGGVPLNCHSYHITWHCLCSSSPPPRDSPAIQNKQNKPH